MLRDPVQPTPRFRFLHGPCFWPRMQPQAQRTVNTDGCCQLIRGSLFDRDYDGDDVSGWRWLSTLGSVNVWSKVLKKCKQTGDHGCF